MTDEQRIAEIVERRAKLARGEWSALWPPAHEDIKFILDKLDEATRERFVLAKLASDKPAFFNPLDVYEAKKIRCRVLALGQP